MTSRYKARLIAKAALEKKAVDVVILDMRGLTALTDYFVISSGTSSRQVKAISDGICESLNHSKSEARHIEGYLQGEWILLDYGSAIAHVFKTETRDFYGLDSLWGDAPRVKTR